MRDKTRAQEEYTCTMSVNEGLKAKTEGSKRLTYAGLLRGRGYLKIGTILKGERFESANGE